MKACIKQDSSRSRGCGIIAVDGAAPFEGNPTYVIESSDGLFLTPTGWASIRTPVTVADGDYIYSRGDGSLNISIGPEILNSLDSLSAYRISVNGEAPVSLAIPEELSLGLMKDASGVGGGVPKPEPAPAPAPEPEPEPEPEPAPEPEPEPEPVPDLNLGDEEPAKKKRSPLVYVLAALAVLGIMGAIAWFVLGKDSGPAPQAPSQNATMPSQNATMPAQSQPAPDAAKPAEKPGDAGSAKAPAESQPFLAQARGMLKKGVEPAEALKAAKAMRTEKASSDDSDGAFLLLEEAAENGSAEAMYLYAQFYDPTCTLPHGTIQPDLAQAHDWYKKASEAGYAGAAKDMERLKAAVSEKAQKGDSAAAALLKAW